MNWFTRQQNLDVTFETSDHSNLGGLSCHCCAMGRELIKPRTTGKRFAPRERHGYSAPKRQRLFMTQ